MATLFLDHIPSDILQHIKFNNNTLQIIQKKQKVVWDPKMTFESCRNRREIAGSWIGNVARE
jgi:hypothetical protein